MKKYEFTGKNIEKAIEQGLKELNKTNDEVDIKIISEGGLFSKAKVEITVEDAEDKKEERLEKQEAKIEPVKESEVVVDAKECDEHCECCTQYVDEQNDVQEQVAEVVEQEKKEEACVEYENCEEVFNLVKDFFETVVKDLNIEAEIRVIEETEAFKVRINGDTEKLGALIGFRGEGLNAYQYLINVLASKKGKTKRIFLDVENYRSRRDDSLRGLARRIAKKVSATKRCYKLEPMNSYERRVIHEELSTYDGITTYSEGEEPNRRLVVDIDKD